MPLEPPKAVLAEHDDRTYVVWDGQRSEIDLSNKAVSLALGVDTDAPQPVKISTPLFDALPATEPLNTPVIPGAGAPSQFNVARGAVVGSVLSVRDLQTDADNFYVLLRNGVQPISPFVASLLRSANSFGDEVPVVVAPDRLASVPVVETLPVDYYPTTRLELVDTASNPVTCLNWSKGSTDRSSETVVMSGKGLPIPIGSDNQLLRLVKNDRIGHEHRGRPGIYVSGGDQPGDDHRCRAGRHQPRVHVVDQRPGRAVRNLAGRRHAAGTGHFTAHGATGAVAVDPGVRSRACAQSHRRDDTA